MIEKAADIARVAIDNIRREYPHDLRHLLTGPDDELPRPRELHPVFYGSYDWHSCVEMYWLLVRMLRTAPDGLPTEDIRAVLDEHLTTEKLAVETAYLVANPGFSRPYGRGWALLLAADLAAWDDPDGRRWAEALAELAAEIATNLIAWLPKVTYPVRYGFHNNSAFGLSRAVPYAETADPVLLAAIHEAARRWFGNDIAYPAGWEPGGSDFLSPALVEAELMSSVLPAGEFVAWFGGFLPGLGVRQPAALFTPAVVSDDSDGQIAHLHGLNLNRAWAFRRLAAVLPNDDGRIPVLRAAADEHAAAALPRVVGGDYMVEHWLAAYAVLLATD